MHIQAAKVQQQLITFQKQLHNTNKDGRKTRFGPRPVDNDDASSTSTTAINMHAVNGIHNTYPNDATPFQKQTISEQQYYRPRGNNHDCSISLMSSNSNGPGVSSNADNMAGLDSYLNQLFPPEINQPKSSNLTENETGCAKDHNSNYPNKDPTEDLTQCLTGSNKQRQAICALSGVWRSIEDLHVISVEKEIQHFCIFDFACFTVDHFCLILLFRYYFLISFTDLLPSYIIRFEYLWMWFLGENYFHL